MHPRNPYRQKKPDFKALALKYDFFRQFVSTSLTGKCVLDFKQPEALKALLKALLKEDFGIEIDVPVDRLVDCFRKPSRGWVNVFAGEWLV